MKTFFKSALSFVLSLLALLLLISALISSTALNEDFMLDKMYAVKYYDDAQDRFIDDASSIFTSNNLLSGTLSAYVNKDDMRATTKANVHAFYIGTAGRSDASGLFNNMQKEIIKNLEASTSVVTDEVEKVVSQIVEQTQYIYSQYTILPMEPVITTLRNVYKFAYSPIFFVAILAVAIMSGLALYRLCADVSELADWLTCGALGTGLACFILPLICKLSGAAKGLMDSSLIYYKLFLECANSILMTAIIAGAIIIIGTIVARIAVGKVLKRDKNTNNETGKFHYKPSQEAVQKP
ncbi:MAG: hypothetical protein RR508_04955 [Oscillospiraceae bacterium]